MRWALGLTGYDAPPDGVRIAALSTASTTYALPALRRARPHTGVAVPPHRRGLLRLVSLQLLLASGAALALPPSRCGESSVRDARRRYPPRRAVADDGVVVDGNAALDVAATETLRQERRGASAK